MSTEDKTNEQEETATENFEETVGGQGTSESEPIDIEDGDDKAVAKIQEEILAAKDKYLRLYSEFENYKRRTSKERLELIQAANEELLKAIIPVLDDFERAEKTFGEIPSEEQQGFLLIMNKFKKILDQFGVKQMEVAQGANFDSDLHEAITQIPAPEQRLKGKVVDVVEKGYLLGEKVIRYAKVVVGN